MFVNGIDVGSVTSQGGMEQLSVGNDIFIGGYDQDELPVGIKVSGHKKKIEISWISQANFNLLG